MQIRATKFTFTVPEGTVNWIASTDYKLWWKNNVQKIDINTQHRPSAVTSMGVVEHENNGLLSSVEVHVPLPKHHINAALRNHLYSLGNYGDLQIEAEEYSVPFSEFCEIYRCSPSRHDVVEAK